MSLALSEQRQPQLEEPIRTMETMTVTVSLPKSLLAAVGVREEDLDALIREWIAVELYRRGRVSLGKAAEVAGVATKWEMLGTLARHDIWIDYAAEDAVQDAEVLADAFGR